LYSSTHRALKPGNTRRCRGPSYRSASGPPRSLPPPRHSLPGARAEIEALRSKIATLQDQVNGLYATSLYAQGEQAREVQADLKRQQGNLDAANNSLTEDEAALRDAMDQARTILFEQDDAGEPMLGGWLPATPTDSTGAGALMVNVPNPDYPGPAPNFDRAVYYAYGTAEAASQAMADGTSM